MNKLLTKVIGTAVGFAMAIGIGVGASLSQKSISSAKAEEATYTITPANLSGWSSSQTAQEGSSGVFTLAATSGANNTQIRNYSGSSLTLTCTVGKMSKAIFTCTANGTANYGPGKMSGSGYVASDGKTGTWTGDAASFTLSGGQARITSIEITYDKPAVGDPTSIVCAEQTISVTESRSLKNATSILPVGAETDLSFAIKEGNEYIDLDTTTGIVFGKKNGTAVVTITPDNTDGGATAIDVNVNVTAIDAPAFSDGDKFVIYAVDEEDSYQGEMTGIDGGNLGVSTVFEGDTPACTYVLEVGVGYCENTVTLSDGSHYLAFSGSNNVFKTSDDVTAESSWTLAFNETTKEGLIKNAALPARSIQFNYNNGNPRFSVYASAQKPISLYPFVEKDLVDFSIESSLDVYLSGTAKINVTYNPADAADKDLTWESANDAIASVDNTGVVTGVALGETIITAWKMIAGDKVERTCNVRVLNNVAAHKGTAADPFDVNDAVQVARGVFTKDSESNPINLSNEYYVKGMVTSAGSRTMNTLTLWIGDSADQISTATGAFEIYQAGKVYGTALATYYNGLSNNVVAADFANGNIIVIKSTITLYNNIPETNQGAADVVYSNGIEGRHYAEAFNTRLEAVCDADGDTDMTDLSTAWGTSKGDWDVLDQDTKDLLTATKGKTTSGATAIEKCVAKYDFIAGKYTTQLGGEYDFMGRSPAPIPNPTNISLMHDMNNSVLVIIVAASIATISLAGTFFMLRKRKEHN